jgi:predicted transcriptional regulator of viral defense system
MATISKEKAIKILHQKRVIFFTVNDARKIFDVERENTLYKLLQRLEKSKIIRRIIKGRYHFSFKEFNDFSLANFLVNPSYISLESALSFYGILPQFPYTITSITPLKSRKIIYQEKEYEFSHIERKHFFSFEKKNSFLMATPEKAFLDELYLMAKNLRKIHFEDLDIKIIDKKKLKDITKEYNFFPLKRLIERLNLC